MNKNTKLNRKMLAILMCLMLIVSCFAGAVAEEEAGAPGAAEGQEIENLSTDGNGAEDLSDDTDDANLPNLDNSDADDAEEDVENETEDETDDSVQDDADNVNDNDVDPENDPETDPEADPEADPEPEIDPETDPEADPDPETDPETDPEPEADPETDPEESDAEEDGAETDETSADQEFAYEYERDENGELILDEKGNPQVKDNDSEYIPVSFQRDENGDLVLDENGNPIPVQLIPADAQLIQTLADALNPNRFIDIYAAWDNGIPVFGGIVTFTAVLYGYEGAEYTVQWQQSHDCEVWHDIEGATDLDFSIEVTKANFEDYWRIQVIITGIAP